MKEYKDGYHLSPTMLDKFQAWQESESSWEKYYGYSDIPKYSLQEWDEKLENDLLDAINKVEGEPSRAADLGTCLNEIVDCILLNRKSTRDDVAIQSFTTEWGNVIGAQKGENKFMFHKDDALNLASWLEGYTPQEFVSADIDTEYGKVQLYGYPDYYREDGIVIDLKTTSRYQGGKFRNKWQRFVYPYILAMSGKIYNYKEFTFLVCQTGGETMSNPFVELTMWRETYTDPIAKFEKEISGVCERFISYYEEAMRRGKASDRLVGRRGE